MSGYRFQRVDGWLNEPGTAGRRMGRAVALSVAVVAVLMVTFTGLYWLAATVIG